MKTALQILVLAATGIVLFFGSSAWPAMVPQFKADRPVMEAGRAGEVYVQLQFEAPELARPKAERSALNLALVIDRSGSMAEKGKLEYAKQAALMLVSSLKPEDRLTLVQYDDRVQTLWDGTPVGDGAALRRLIHSMQPGGSTNLHGGLRAGVTGCVRNRHSETSRVFLLSDGLANVGQTDPAAIAAVATQGRVQGVRVSSMGLGVDYDEDLMQAVAEAGGGSYHFIENPAQTVAIYERELQVLSSMVTRDYRLRFVPSGRVRNVMVYGYPQERSGDGWAVTLDDFYSGEKRTLLLKLDVADVTEAANDLGRFEWQYVDVASGREERAGAPLAVQGSRDPAAVEAATNKTIVAESALARAEQEHKEAVKLFESGKTAEAQDRMKSLKSSLATQNAAAPSVALRKKMEALDVESEMQDKSVNDSALRGNYLKKSKENIYKSAKGKRQSVMLSPGDVGQEVTALQQALQQNGSYKGSIDGKYNADVEAAVREYQKKNGMDADGVAGPKVLQGLGLY